MPNHAALVRRVRSSAIEQLEQRTLCASSLFPVAATYHTSVVSHVVSGDFDGNGTIDLATNNGTVLLNKGNGSFKRGPDYPSTNAGLNAPNIIAGDFDGDGRADVAGFFEDEVTWKSEFSVFFSRGKGRFHAPNVFADILPRGRPMAADVNGDRTPDIVISQNSGIVVMLGRLDRTFDIKAYPAPNVGKHGVAPGTMCAADFDGDGDVDLFGGAARLRTPIYFNDGAGRFDRKAIVQQQNSVCATGDFNRDRKADLIVGSLMLAGNGDGTFKPGVAIPNALDGVRAVADFNGDRRLDLIVSANDSMIKTVSVLLGKSNGTFRLSETFKPRPGNIIGPAMDVNRDGRADFVAFAYPTIFGVRGGDVYPEDDWFAPEQPSVVLTVMLTS